MLRNEKDLKELDAAFNRSVRTLNNELHAFQEQQKIELNRIIKSLKIK